MCKEKEEQRDKKLKEIELFEKDEELEHRCGSANSYTISNPIFSQDILPKANELISSSDERTESSDKETIIDGSITIQSIEEDEQHHSEKELKDAQNEFDKRSVTTSSSVFDDFQPNEDKMKIELKKLSDKQKAEHLKVMELLYRKFATERHQLVEKLQSKSKMLLPQTSTPLNSSSISFVNTEDEEFEEFQTCLQNSENAEKTLVNETDLRERAATKINACARGFLLRRLMRTIYVQQHIKNITETLQFVLSLNDNHKTSNPIQDQILKTKLFKQLQRDLYRFSEIFNKYLIKEKMKIIADDRAIRIKNLIQKNREILECSFQTI